VTVAETKLVRAAGAVLGAGVVLAVVRRRLVAVRVVGASMEPTYDDGERVLVRRAPARALRWGQVVVFEEPDVAGRWSRLARGEAGRGWMIKRVVALPGDPVPRARVPRLADRPEATVPPGHLVVVGDNPRGSFDSRAFGYVPADRVLGVVIRRLGRSLPAGGPPGPERWPAPERPRPDMTPV
jgi:signal peptidase I